MMKTKPSKRNHKTKNRTKRRPAAKRPGRKWLLTEVAKQTEQINRLQVQLNLATKNCQHADREIEAVKESLAFEKTNGRIKDEIAQKCAAMCTEIGAVAQRVVQYNTAIQQSFALLKTAMRK